MELERGYATVAVTALMSALSLLAIGYSHLSIAEARKVNRVTEQVKLDAALESVFHETVYDLLSSRLAYSEQAPHRTQYQDEAFTVAFQIENSKTDINRTSVGVIEAELSKHLPPGQANRLLGSIGPEPRRGEVRFDTLESYEALADNATSLACLRDQFSLFRSTAVVGANEHDGSRYIQDGLILRLMIETDSDRIYRALDTVVLFTGIENDPFWVLGWQRRGAGDLGECRNAK